MTFENLCIQKMITFQIYRPPFSKNGECRIYLSTHVFFFPYYRIVYITNGYNANG